MADVDLSGRWSGVYFFPVDAELNPFDDWPPTPFTAELSDEAGLVTGTTEEPDLISEDAAAAPIRATLEGHHHQGVLTFTKAPQDSWQMHTIDYVGTISADGNSISGDWIIHGDWSGKFRMQRSDTMAVEAVEREATA